MFGSDLVASGDAPTEITERADFEAGLEIVLDGIAAKVEGPGTLETGLR